MSTELRRLRPGETAFPQPTGDRAHISLKPYLGFVIIALRCSCATNRLQFPSRQQVVNCLARLSWGYGPLTQPYT